MLRDDDRRPEVGETGGPVDVFILVAIAGLLIARIPTIAIRGFDPDEFEHSHAAWSVFRGLLPYRDFFEHHTPWYYFALAPFFHWFPVDQSSADGRSFLAFARGVSLALTALSAGFLILLGRLLAARRVGLLAALFLVAQPVVIQKTLEIRPDVPALPFLLGGLYLLVRALTRSGEEPTRRSLPWFIGGGLCLGAGIMCTQKMLFVLPGAFTGLGLWALAGGRRALLARSLAVLAALVGVAVPFAATWIAFAVQDGGRQFIYNNFILNSQWRARSNRHLQLIFETSVPMLIACVVGVAVALKRFRRADQRRYGELLLLCTLAGLIGGVAIVPAAYRQYYLMPLSIACLFAAQGLVFLVELAREPLRRWLFLGATALLLVWPAFEIRSAFAWRNDQQIANLRYVYAHTRPTDTVLDGWMGTQVFRPHPLYYGFMHGEVLAMLSERDVEAYFSALESGKVRPALITLDDELKRFGPRFLNFLNAHYVSANGLFYFPRATGTFPRATGTFPRATGTFPRATGTFPRATGTATGPQRRP
jgi:4-amino-4-deoxy-L-arabinose transferase-like glycosyltransferase